MGWRGLTRSLVAAARRAEREEVRRQRALMRHQHEVSKQMAAAHAAQVVAEHQAFVRRLVTVHLNGSPARDWQALARVQPPQQPTYASYHEQHAEQVLAAYKPGLGERLLGKADARRQQLEQAVWDARQHDQVAHQRAMAHYQEAQQRWQWESELASRILRGDLDAHRTALEYLFPIAQIPELAAIDIRCSAAWYADATMELHSDDDLIPDEYPVQLKTGKRSWKKLPKGKYNELHQDHVCSCALRIGWELLALVPIKVAVVHVMMDLLNTASGHLEQTPILSVAIMRDTLLRLNPERIDPSDAMSNFKHNMQFSARTGFSPVARLVEADLSSHGYR